MPTWVPSRDIRPATDLVSGISQEKTRTGGLDVHNVFINFSSVWEDQWDLGFGVPASAPILLSVSVNSQFYPILFFPMWVWICPSWTWSLLHDDWKLSGPWKKLSALPPMFSLWLSKGTSNANFHWTSYPLGVLLAYTRYKICWDYIILSSDLTLGMWRFTSHNASHITHYVNKDPTWFWYGPIMSNWGLPTWPL